MSLLLQKPHLVKISQTVGFYDLTKPNSEEPQEEFFFSNTVRYTQLAFILVVGDPSSENIGFHQPRSV